MIKRKNLFGFLIVLVVNYSYFTTEPGLIIQFETLYLIDGCETLATSTDVKRVRDTTYYKLRYTNCEGMVMIQDRDTPLLVKENEKKLVRISRFTDFVGFMPFIWWVYAWLLFIQLCLIYLAYRSYYGIPEWYEAYYNDPNKPAKKIVKNDQSIQA